MPIVTPERIAELRRLLAEATPRPWYVSDELGLAVAAVVEGAGFMVADMSGESSSWRGRPADAALIAALVNAAPELIELAERRAMDHVNFGHY